MKIAEIKTYPLMYMKESPKIPRTFLLCKITTDDGLVGWGEASSAYGHSYPLVVKEIIDHTLSRLVIGEDPRDIEKLVSKMRTWIWGYLGPVGVSNQAIAAVEIAMWDIVGKAAGQPVYKLLGAFRVKCRVGKSKDWDEAFVANIREFIGDNKKLFIDAYMTYTPETAFEMAGRFAGYKPYFFEEPISLYDLESLEKISKESPVPIALGERVTSLYEFKNLREKHIGQIWQPDACIAGGISEAKKICALGEAYSIECIPHIGGITAVGIAANLNLALSCRNVKQLEVDGAMLQPMRDDIIEDDIFNIARIKDGMLRPSGRPGLGIEIREDVLKDFKYERGPVYPDFYPQYGSGIL